jgi:hypothetical protein
MRDGARLSQASHRAITVALSLSTGAGLKKIREKIGTRRFLFDLEVLAFANLATSLS